MKILKVLSGEESIDRKTYILWTLPFAVILSVFLLAEYVPLFEMMLIFLFGQVSIWDFGEHMIFLLLLNGISFAMVFILSGKRLVELDMAWQYALLLFLLPAFHFLYFYLVFKKEPGWKTAERSKRKI
ncbi:MAG TPA: hypothetical protein DHM90_09605 [Clostridiaceae bacterium]|nr:hypothetical protein [Clostridiaceae bacterium]